MSMSNEQKELLNVIHSIGFALYDTVLFLDTHPNDQDALAYYNQCKKVLEQAEKEYTTYFGPLTSDNVNTKNYWTWVKGPWPWQGEE